MFKSLRRYYWVSQAFLARHSSIIIRTAVSVLVIVVVFVLFARYIPTPKDTLRIARVGKYSSETLPLDIQSMVSAGLVSFSPDGRISPSLAKSWEIKDDGRTYVFALDTDLRWHDGSTLSPSDITYNFQDVEIEQGVDSVTFRLKEPFSPFFSAVARPILKNNKWGTADFRLVKSKINSGVLQSLTLESELERLVYKFYPTESSSLTAYKLGEVDTVEKLSLIPESFSSDSTSLIQQDSNQEGRQVVLFFNNNDIILSSKSARQALAYAIEDKTFGHTRTISPIDDSSWVYNNLVKTYDFEPEHALNLLAQDNPDTSSLKLELKTILPYLDVAESIATSWREVLGIQVEVKVITSVSGDYQILLSDFTPPVDPDQYPIWHSTQSTNFTHYSNLKIDKLLEDGRRTSDQKLRKEIYQDFQRFLLEDSPAVFLFKNNTFTLTRKPLL